MSWLLAIMAIGSPTSAYGEQVTYVFTKIADTSGAFTSFDNPYSINTSGEVAFTAHIAGGISEIHVGDGTFTRLVADTRGPFDSFTFPPSLNTAGTVAFSAMLDGGGEEIRTVTAAGGSTVIADTTGPFSSVVQGRINDLAEVAYFAILDAGGQEIRKADGATSTLIVDTTGPYEAFQTGSAIDADGTVSYFAFLDSGSGEEVGYGDGTMTTTIFSSAGNDSIFLSPAAHSINGAHKVPFIVNTVGTEPDQLRLGNGDGTTLVVSGGPFSSGAPAVTNADVVAFVEGSEIFTTLNLLNPVIGAGDMLDGKLVSRLDYAGALNESNQLAFHAFFQDGSEGIYLATAVPEPSTVALLLAGISVLALCIAARPCIKKTQAKADIGSAG